MKKISTLLFVAVTVTSVFGQGFSTISIEDAAGVKALTQVSVRGGASELQAVVPANFDLAHVVITATAATDSEILTNPLPSDFSVTNPQTISVKNASSTRNFQFTIRKLIPDALPFEFSAPATTIADWTTTTVGWAHAGIDFNQAGVIRYGTVTPTFIVGFTDSPKDVTYDLQVVGAALTANDEFNVEASADGITWRTLKSFKEAGAIVANSTGWTTTKNDLEASDKYVRWQYVKRTNNLNLNNIVVSKADGGNTTLSSEQVLTSVFYQSAPGELTFTQPAAKMEVYNLLGGKTAEYAHPQGVVSITDGVKGITLVRVQLENGSVITEKVVK